METGGPTIIGVALGFGITVGLGVALGLGTVVGFGVAGPDGTTTIGVAVTTGVFGEFVFP